MTGTSENNGDVVYGYPQNSPQYIPYPQYVLLPGPPRRVRSKKTCILWSSFRLLLVAFLLVSLGAMGYLLFPRQPEIKVRKIMLEKINLHVKDKESIIPTVYLDVSLSLLLKITNPNFFDVNYDKVQVLFSYRGDNLGKVESEGGEVPRRSVVHATARLDLQGTKLLEHTADLISDVTNREVPMETVTSFTGAVEMFFLKPHIKVKVYCSMVIDPFEEEVLKKDCSLRPFT